VAFADEDRTSAGFRLRPSNGEYDPETGQVVADPGETLAYEVVEAVGLRRDGGDGTGDDGADGAESPSAAPPAAAPASAGGLVLGGDDLGVTRVGAPYEQAVRALSQVLGPPVANPSATTACVGAGQLEVEWRAFRLAVTDGQVSGWLSSDPRLRTPSDLRLGTTVAQAEQVLREGLRVYEPNPDSAAGFTVDGVELGGALTGTGPAGRITSFWNRACSPP
jgi:hypothetical protein